MIRCCLLACWCATPNRAQRPHGLSTQCQCTGQVVQPVCLLLLVRRPLSMTAGEEQAEAAAAAPAPPGRGLQRTTTMLAYRKVCSRFLCQCGCWRFAWGAACLTAGMKRGQQRTATMLAYCNACPAFACACSMQCAAQGWERVIGAEWACVHVSHCATALLTPVLRCRCRWPRASSRRQRRRRQQVGSC